MANKKQKSPFNDKFLKEVRDILTERKTSLERDLAGFTKRSTIDPQDFDAQFPEYGTEEDDNAREVAEYTTNKPLELTLEKELRDVIKSLKRLDEDMYGTCKYWGNAIDEKRLLARPTSSSCVSCKKTLTNEA